MPNGLPDSSPTWARFAPAAGVPGGLKQPDSAASQAWSRLSLGLSAGARAEAGASLWGVYKMLTRVLTHPVDPFEAKPPKGQCAGPSRQAGTRRFGGSVARGRAA